MDELLPPVGDNGEDEDDDVLADGDEAAKLAGAAVIAVGD